MPYAYVALVDDVGRQLGLLFIAGYADGTHFAHCSRKFLAGMELLSSLNFRVTLTLIGLYRRLVLGQKVISQCWRLLTCPRLNQLFDFRGRGRLYRCVEASADQRLLTWINVKKNSKV